MSTNSSPIKSNTWCYNLNISNDYQSRPRTGRFDTFHEAGTYSCVVCREDLFTSNLKYDSGCGWPAFFDSIDHTKIAIELDYQLSECHMILLTNLSAPVFQVYSLTQVTLLPIQSMKIMNY